MLRAAVAAGTEVGREAKAYMDSGNLVPDATMIGVVSLLAKLSLADWLIGGLGVVDCGIRTYERLFDFMLSLFCRVVSCSVS